MYKKIIFFLFIIIVKLFQAQKINKIEFEHSNAILINSRTNIVLEIEPKKNNKQKIILDSENKSIYNTKKISKKKYTKICNAILKIKSDTIAVLGNSIDGSATRITIYDNFNKKKSYYADYLHKKSEDNEFQKDFWNATKLIITAARMKMEDLVDY